MSTAVQSDFTGAAEALFGSFAYKYGLNYRVESGGPMEVRWIFPEHPELSTELVLGLQNGDELNFGVEGFWSYFFPFNEVSDQFALILDCWMEGKARVGMIGRKSGVLQLRENGKWKTVYHANFLFSFWRRPSRFIENSPSSISSPRI